MIEWFEHPVRVRDAREATALLRELGAHRVRVTQHHVRAWVLKDPARIQRVLATVEPAASTTIDIEGITREATAPLLAKLVAGDAEFITIAGTTATLRVWPRRNEAFVDEIALPRHAAFERFRDACAVTWINAHVSGPGADVVAMLPRVFAELDQPELEIDFELPLDVALELALAYPDSELEWCGGAVIRLPAGEVATYEVAPAADFEARWRSKIDDAFTTIRS